MPLKWNSKSCFASGARRILALILCAALLPLEPAFSAPSSGPEVPDKILENGSVELFVPGHSGRTVYVIQDAHDSLEAQENIAAMTTALVESSGVREVFEEGYEGKVPTDFYFRDIQDAGLRKKVSYYLMDKLRIGGAEYAHINRGKDFELYGADNIRLHFENVSAYRENAAAQDRVHQDLVLLESEMRRLSDRVFDSPLKEWMRLKERFDGGSLDLSGYVRRVLGLLGPGEAPGVRFPLLEMMVRGNRTPQEDRFLESADARNFFSEIESLEKTLARQHLAGAEDLELFEMLRSVRLLKRLNSLKVSAAEYDALKDFLSRFDTQKAADFIARRNGRPVVLSKAWEENMEPAFRFYETARARDEAVEKTLAARPANKAVIVYGGFHLEAIKRILKKRGDSFYVLTPRISAESSRHEAYYQELMLGGFERLTVPGLLKTAAVPPRLYEFSALDPARSGELKSLVARLAAAADAVPMGDSLRFSSEMDLRVLRESSAAPRTERSELRNAEPMTAVEIHAYRLARERKPVSLPYFSRHHGVSRAEAVRALENAGFEFSGPSETGDLYLYPMTPERERRLLEMNPVTGEDPARTQPLESVGEELLEINGMLETQQPGEPEKTLFLSPSPAESDGSGIFHFRDRTIHGLNNIATFLLLSPRAVSYYTLRNTVDDLWASIKVLDDLADGPPKEYRRISPSIQDVVYGHNAATRIGASAVRSAEEGQFLPVHTQEIRNLRVLLELVYGRAARLLNEREREFLSEAEREENSSTQRWEDAADVSFSDIDPVLREKISAFDLELVRRILSGSREDIRNLAKEHPGNVYFKSEDGNFLMEGRTVYLRLEEPVEITVRGAIHRLTQLRIKGLRSESGEPGMPAYDGQGRVDYRIIPAADGTLNSFENPPSPRGGLRTADAGTEYEVMKRSLEAAGYETDYPVAWGVYEGRPFLGEPTGFVIAGFEGEDVRLTSAYGMSDEERVIAYAPVQSRDLMSLDQGSEMVFYRMLGRALRAYHDAGFYHGYPHLGNIGIRRTRGEIAVILRDLNTTAFRTPEMSAEQEAAYRFIDTADVLVRLLNIGREDLSEYFLSGYFKLMPQTSPDFQQMTAASKDLKFLLKFLQLDHTLPPTVELEDGSVVNIREEHPPISSMKIHSEDPGFGVLWKNLLLLSGTRSELRTEDLKDFLHEQVFLRRFGHYEILADYRYEDFEAIDRKTLALLPKTSLSPKAFRIVLLNGYYGPRAEGRKHPHLVILGGEGGTLKAMGLAALQDAETFLDGLDDPAVFKDGESLEQSYYVTRTDVFSDYQGEALMQRAVTVLLLKGDVKKWIPSGIQLFPSRRMYERMKADPRLHLEGRLRTRVVTANPGSIEAVPSSKEQGIRSAGVRTQRELVLHISENWDSIRERGFFMFDMQKTLAARKKPASEGMIRLLAWMLQERIRLVINSGNPMKDVEDQILAPLKKFLAAEGKAHLLANGAFSVYSASGTVFVTMDEQGNPVEHPDYEAGLRISRPVLEQTIHDVLVEFAQKKFGLDEAGIAELRAAYAKDAAKNPGLIYELPWADRPEAYRPSRVHFDDLGNKAMSVQGPYIQFRGSRVTDLETTSITITKLPPGIRPLMIDRLKELLAQRLGEDSLNRLSLSVGGESSIDIYSADANKAKALIHYAGYAAKNDGRPLDFRLGYYFGDELTARVHGSTMTEKIHKGNDMIVAEYPFPDRQYEQIRLAALPPDYPEGFNGRDADRTYWAGREETGTEELFHQVRTAVEAAKNPMSAKEPPASEGRSELRAENELLRLPEAQLLRRLRRTPFPLFLGSSTSYVLLSPDTGAVIKFFDPVSPFTMHADELWKFWLRGALKTLLLWPSSPSKKYGEGYRVMARYRREHPELPEHVPTRVIEGRNPMRLTGIPPQMRLLLSPFRQWVVQAYVPRKWFVNSRLAEAVREGDLDRAQRILDGALDYMKTFWRHGYTDADLGINVLENYVIAGPAGIKDFSVRDFDFHDQGAFTSDPRQIRRFFESVRRSVVKIDEGLSSGQSLREVLSALEGAKPEYPLRNILARFDELLPGHPAESEILARHFLSRVRAEFTLESWEREFRAGSYRSELRMEAGLVDTWKKSLPEEKEKMLSREEVLKYSGDDDFADWLMYVLLDPNFVYRRRVVELNNWEPGLRLDPAYLLEHLEKPWVSLEAYGAPAVPEGAAFDETQALRNKRMALLILLTERGAEYLSGRFSGSSTESKIYVEEILERIRGGIGEDQASQGAQDALYENLKKTINELGDFALGAKRPMNFLEVFLLESLRYDLKLPEEKSRDAYGWFHDDYFVGFVYALGSPVLQSILDRITERAIDERPKLDPPAVMSGFLYSAGLPLRTGRSVDFKSDRRSELRGLFSAETLEEALRALALARDADQRREALADLRILTVQKNVKLDVTRRVEQAKALLSFLADPDSGVRNGAARAAARIENFPFETLLEFLRRPVVDARYGEISGYEASIGIRNARLAALYALAHSRQEDALRRRPARWEIFSRTLTADDWGEPEKSIASDEQARRVLAIDGKLALSDIVSAASYADGPWAYARTAAHEILPMLPDEIRGRLAVPAEVNRRSELRTLRPAFDVREQLEKTAAQPGVIFIAYDEIRGDQNPARDQLLAIGARVRSDRATKIFVYGVDAADLMNPEVRELRDAAGIQTFQEDLGTVYRRVALSEEPGKDRASFFVHWATQAERLRNPPGDVLLFLGSVPGDLAAALLLARSGGSLPGVSKNGQGFYSVTENFLREELQRYQASLVIGRSA